MEKLDPKENHQDKIIFLSQFPWEKSALNDEKKAVVGKLLVEFSKVKPRSAPIHLLMFDSSSSDEAFPNLFDKNSSSDENLADLNLDAEQIARTPIDPLIADKIRQQEPEICVPLVSSSSDDEICSPSQQPQPAIAPLDVESPPETHEEQFALTEKKMRS